ncbi:MAG TPA: hypothetical protein VGK73_15360 [Polyangiaceae bacterium]
MPNACSQHAQHAQHAPPAPSLDRLGSRLVRCADHPHGAPVLRYFKRRWDEPRGDEHDSWGSSTWYFEVNDDGYPVRQLEQYELGTVRKYDKIHSDDELGGLSEVALDFDEFRPFEIDAAAFEAAWSSPPARIERRGEARSNQLDLAGERRQRLAVALSILSGSLTVAAAGALTVGWCWASTRGDWQAFVLWSYWFVTPLSSGVALAIASKSLTMKRVTVSLLSVWGVASLFALIVPFVS